MNDPPTFIRPSGTKEWHLNKVNKILHRTDGPAVEWETGTKSWYQHGKRHRLDGPAIEWSDGTVAFWVDGYRLETVHEWAAWVLRFQCRRVTPDAVEQIVKECLQKKNQGDHLIAMKLLRTESLDGGRIVEYYTDGITHHTYPNSRRRCWYKNENYHCEFGPAVISLDDPADCAWYCNREFYKYPFDWASAVMYYQKREDWNDQDAINSFLRSVLSNLTQEII